MTQGTKCPRCGRGLRRVGAALKCIGCSATATTASTSRNPAATAVSDALRKRCSRCGRDVTFGPRSRDGAKGYLCGECAQGTLQAPPSSPHLGTCASCNQPAPQGELKSEAGVKQCANCRT